jgi:DNA-binding SARP family transcriptional activator/predicted ATPase
MSGLRLCLLGTLEVTWDGQVVPALTSEKLRALLGYLAIEEERPHRRGALAGLLWPAQPDRLARHSLRQALFTLRRSLRPAGGAPPLLASRGEVWFNPAAKSWVDVKVFASLISACAAHAHARDALCEACERRLAEAVALYRGGFLSEISLSDCAEFEQWVVLRRERLHLVATDALARLAASYERRGQLDLARGAAERHLELDPWCEPAHRQLMRALHLSGQRAAGLAAYERCRRVLELELGVEPEAETSALYERIRRGADADVLVPPGHDDRTGVATNLPMEPDPLIGREPELAALAGRLADPHCRLLTLTGPGGIGKTRLALEAARRQGPYFPDGVTFVPLSAVRGSERLPTAIADAMAFPLYGREHPRDQLLAALQDRERLLVLDSFEHLMGGAELIAEIMKRAPGVTFLVTSCERLNLRGEWVFEVEGLGLPHDESAAALENSSAVRLFLHSARKVSTGGGIGRQDRAALARICRLVGGMPLALELAAGWTSLLSCDEIAGEIEKNIDFLTSPQRDVPARHRSMRAVFDRSWQMLEPRERDVFKRLAVFRQGFDREAASRVAGASLRDLASLTGKSFLRPTAAHRFQLHDLLRQYGEARLGERPGEADQLGDRHAEYFAAFLSAREADLKGGRQRAAADELVPEIENVRAAWNRAVTRGRWDLVTSMASTLWLFHTFDDRLHVAADTFGRAAAQIEGSEAGDPRSRTCALAKVLSSQGAYLMRLGMCPEARRVLERSLILFERLKVPGERALALNFLAATVHLLGTYREEERWLRASLRDFTSIDDAWGMAYSSNDLGLAVHLQGRHAEARRLCGRSLALFRQLGDRRGLGFALYNLGTIAAHLGEHDEAARLHREGLAHRRAIGDRWGAAASLAQLATVCRLQGATEAAAHCLQEALRHALPIRATPIVVDALLEQAALFDRTGEAGKAAEILMAVLEQAGDNPALQVRASILLGNVRNGEAALASAAAGQRVARLESLAETLLRCDGEPSLL